jgi:hypothetical protein
MHSAHTPLDSEGLSAHHHRHRGGETESGKVEMNLVCGRPHQDKLWCPPVPSCFRCTPRYPSPVSRDTLDRSRPPARTSTRHKTSRQGREGMEGFLSAPCPSREYYLYGFYSGSERLKAGILAQGGQPTLYSGAVWSDVEAQRGREPRSPLASASRFWQNQGKKKRAGWAWLPCIHVAANEGWLDFWASEGTFQTCLLEWTRQQHYVWPA